MGEDHSTYKISNEQSPSTCSGHSHDDQQVSNEESFNLTINKQLRLDLFCNNILNAQISHKASQRAISWIITLCWSKNFDEECVWSTLLLYYCYRSRKDIKKQQLQLLLLSCVSLSLKLTCCKALSMADIISMGSKPLRPHDLIEIQTRILELVNYNAIIPHYIGELYNSTQLSEQNINSIMFLCELFMIKDHTIFFDKEKIENIARLVESQNARTQDYENLRNQIKQMLLLKECRILLNKYASKFDVFKFTSRWT